MDAEFDIVVWKEKKWLRNEWFTDALLKIFGSHVIYIFPKIYIHQEKKKELITWIIIRNISW